MKKRIVVDSSGKEVPVMTVYEAAKYCGITKDAMKLWLYKKKYITLYKLMSPKHVRINRLTVEDVKRFKIDKEMFDRIADRIKEAMQKHTYVKTGMTGRLLAKESGVSCQHISMIICKKTRPDIGSIKKIAKAFKMKFDDLL